MQLATGLEVIHVQEAAISIAIFSVMVIAGAMSQRFQVVRRFCVNKILL
jgi:hypothetical protein